MHNDHDRIQGGGFPNSIHPPQNAFIHYFILILGTYIFLYKAILKIIKT